MKSLSLSVSLLFGTGLFTLPAHAQITPSGATQVNQTGNTLSITGGQFSSDLRNQFHDFQRFGLNANQVANFSTNATVLNILGRVTGGDPSVINGLIQVTGGNANLYLMNPAGVVFGSSASLNVSGSFTATTANGIGIGNQWFSAVGTSDYANLLGTPDSFAFTMSQPGAIINAGNLSVAQGQNLTLVGGTVISTGTLTAPGGAITVTTVPGESLVRITQTGSPLSLELPLADKTQLTSEPTMPGRSLPELLTGGNLASATGVAIDATGTVQLTGSNLSVNQGDVVATSVKAQTATLSANNNLTLSESQLVTTSNLNLLAQNTVQIRDTAAKSLVIQAGETLLIQGNQAVDAFALNNPLSGLYSGKDMVLRSSSPITGDAHYFVGGNLRFEQLNGNVGKLLSPNDPIILALGDVTLGDYTGASLHILAGGSVTLGSISITVAGDTNTTINPDNATFFNATRTFADLATITRADGTPLAYNGTPELDSNGVVQWINPTPLVIRGNERPTLDVRAGIDWSLLGGFPGNGVLPIPLLNEASNAQPFPNQSSFASASSANITTGTIRVNSGNGVDPGGIVLLTNQYSPNTALAGEIRVNPNSAVGENSISTFGGPQSNQVIAIDSRSSVTVGSVDANGLPTGVRGGSPGAARGLFTLGNSVNVQAVENITVGDIDLGSQSQSGNSSVKLVSVQGNILVNTIASGANGIDIQAGGLFQAIGSFDPSGTASTVFTNLRTNAALRSFVLDKLPEGTTLTAEQLDETRFIRTQDLQASILARPISTKPEGSLNAPIKIQHGLGSRTQTSTFDVYPGSNPNNVDRTIGMVIIQGDSVFNGGSLIARQVDTPDSYVNGGQVIPPLNSPDAIPTGFGFNQVYTNLTFDSPNFPATTSGTVGAILVGGGSNGELHGSILQRIFPAAELPMTPATPITSVTPVTPTIPTNPESGAGSSSPSNNSPSVPSTLDLARQRVQGEDGQAAQRQLNTAGQTAEVCQPVPLREKISAQAEITANRIENPCERREDDEQILKILSE